MRQLLLGLLMAAALAATIVPAQSAELAPDAAAMLAYMREEEKLARDVYLHFAQSYAADYPAARIFGRIAESEQRHTDAVLALLNKYGLADPAASLAPGEFADSGMQELYATLIDVGATGFPEAVGVGILIERKDMTDIVAAIGLSIASPDIVQVYSNLLTGSENHLAAFLRVANLAQPAAGVPVAR